MIDDNRSDGNNSRVSLGGNTSEQAAPQRGSSKINVSELFRHMKERNASDLHITVGKAPVVRVDGHLQEIPNMPILSPQHSYRCTEERV